MSTKADALHVIRDLWYAAIDAGRMEDATLALTDDVEWTYQQVRTGRDPGKPPETYWLRGRREVGAFLAARKDAIVNARARHVVDEMVFDDDKAAFIGYVQAEDPVKSYFLAWVELRDDKIFRYVVRPL
jgi:hypothetical protein